MVAVTSSPCDQDLYLSASSDGEGGPITVIAECNGPKDCRFFREWFLPFGITGQSISTLIAAHASGQWEQVEADWGSDARGRS